MSELRRQVETLRRLGSTEVDVGPLEDAAAALEATAEDRIPFVLVAPGSSPAEAIAHVELGGKPGFTSMEPDDLARFRPLYGLEPPDGAYLLADVDTGAATLNVTPDDALADIEREGRSPLTLDEGLALVTHFPEVLRTHNCFSLLGSRCGDRRVTAIWVSERRPRLGWCWAGNPHTWLGSASCGARVAAHATARL